VVSFDLLIGVRHSIVRFAQLLLDKAGTKAAAYHAGDTVDLIPACGILSSLRSITGFPAASPIEALSVLAKSDRSPDIEARIVPPGSAPAAEYRPLARASSERGVYPASPASPASGGDQGSSPGPALWQNTLRVYHQASRLFASSSASDYEFKLRILLQAHFALAETVIDHSPSQTPSDDDAEPPAADQGQVSAATTAADDIKLESASVPAASSAATVTKRRPRVLASSSERSVQVDTRLTPAGDPIASPIGDQSAHTDLHVTQSGLSRSMTLSSGSQSRAAPSVAPTVVRSTSLPASSFQDLITQWHQRECRRLLAQSYGIMAMVSASKRICRLGQSTKHLLLCVYISAAVSRLGSQSHGE